MTVAVGVGCAAGLVLALSFRFFANQAAIRELRRKLWAHVLELWLFGEEPALAFGSLLRVVQINLKLLAHALPALLIAAPIIFLLAASTSDFYARTPLDIGGPAVLTVRLRSASPVKLDIPPSVQIDAPPVSVPSAREVSWRLRASSKNPGACKISTAGESVVKKLDAAIRSRAWRDVLLHPAEARLPAGPIERIWISRSPAQPWLEWFAAAASLGAWLASIVLRRALSLQIWHNMP